MSQAAAQLMKPVGPKAEAFVMDKRLITGIMGPVGSAKTTMCIKKMLLSTVWQNPGPDGIRRARWAVVRDTYPQLKKTVLESWNSWFPKTMGDWNGEAPYTHKISVLVPGMGRLHLEVIFAAIGENKVEDVMRGWELTGLWLNEMDLLSHGVVSYGLGRIGRYPPENLGGCTWRGIIGDMNAPDIENWTYKLFVDEELGLTKEIIEELREVLGDMLGVGFYVQPGGRSKDPPPENIHNLPKGYYAQQMIGQTKDYIRRMIDNEFGAVRRGQPVYPEYRDEFHCAKTKLAPLPGIPLTIGVDGGLTPAAVIGQRTSLNQIRVLAEFVFGAQFTEGDEAQLDQVGPTAFGEGLKAYLADNFPDNEIGNVWVDPSSAAGEAARGEEESSWRKRFAKALGVRVRRCPGGNALTPRLEAVRSPMLRLVDGEPGILISPSCRLVRRGLKGGYVYRRIQLSDGFGRFQDEPLKNDYSHSQDALQYLCVGLSVGGAYGETGRPGRRQGQRRVIRNDSAFGLQGG